MDEPTAAFESFKNSFFSYYQEGDYQGALGLIERDAGRFPAYQAQVLGWQAAVLALMDRADEAVGVLRAAEEQGCWYAADALRGDPDFGNLQERADFRRLVDRLDARREAAARELRPERVLIQPAGEGPHPLLVVLHGNNSSVPITLPIWEAAARENWLVAGIQSSQPAWTSGIYVWNDTDRSLAEMRAHLHELRAAYSVDPGRIVAGGFSMGAQVALRMALDPEFNLRGVIAHETWFDEPGMAQLADQVRNSQRTDTRVVLIAGNENSEYVQIARQIQTMLTDHGMVCDLVLSSNRQHGYPAEFSQLLSEALQRLV